MADIDWAKALDLGQAATNVRSEFIGDWHLDPWGWPEINFVLSHADVFVQHMKSNRADRPALVDVPKENWGSRPAVVLSIMDRLAYQALVDRVSTEMIGTLHRSVYGWRLPPAPAKRGVYSHNNLQWEWYRDHIELSTALFMAGLRTDLVSCFATVPVDSLKEAIDDRLAQGAIKRRLCAFLDEMAKTPGRSGLPQRSLASAVLANMYLRPLDDVLEYFALDIPFVRFGSKETRTFRSWTRWMDDIWLFGDDPSELRVAQLELQNVASSLGMHINSAKTEVLEGDALAETALEIEHSAVDDALDNHSNSAPLEDLIDRLLSDPARAPRTSLKFAALRMRKSSSTYRIEEIAELALQMPHAADALAPLFKMAFTAGSLQDWFLHYAGSSWASFHWSVAKYLHMFPAAKKPRKALRDFVSAVVSDADSPLTLLAICSQRLAAWDPQEARAAFRAIAPRTSHPQHRRVIALASLGAGEGRNMVRRWLNDDDNQVTLQMLEQAKFTAPKVEATYST